MVVLPEPSLLISLSASIVASASPSSRDSATVRSAILLMPGLSSAPIVASACPQQAINLGEYEIFESLGLGGTTPTERQ